MHIYIVYVIVLVNVQVIPGIPIRKYFLHGLIQEMRGSILFCNKYYIYEFDVLANSKNILVSICFLS